MVELVTQYGVSQLGSLGDGVIFVRGCFSDDLDHPHHHAGRAADPGRARHPSGVVRDPAHDQPRARAITPPVGMNLFAIKAITRAPIREIIAGITPYVGLLILGLALVLFFPPIALWLPGTMQYK
jgi:hypothetical protein